MEIRTDNIRAVGEYVKAAKELNAFIKQNFSKKEQSELCISPIIENLHIENDKVQKDINTYNKTNICEYLHKDMYLKGSISTCLVYFNYGLIHIVGNVSDNSKKVTIEYIDMPFMNYGNGESVYITKKKVQANTMDLIQYIMSGKLTECGADEFNKASNMFDIIQTIAKKYQDEFKNEQ